MTDPKPAARPEPSRGKRTVPAASAVLADGTLVELTLEPEEGTTAFAHWKDGRWTRVRHIDTPKDGRLVPYSAANNLIRNNVVLFPAGPEEYESTAKLAGDVQAYIHRYVDVSERFERLASYYVLLTWVYDRFNELPYLRLRGDYGSGKTRFLLTVGAVCNKPMFASGASTVSPLFHTLDAFRGTLVLDESDFRFSDEKAEIVKILNNGNARGFPVLRTEVSAQREYNPRAFHVFGPKIVATRGHFDDRALESRCITEELGGRMLRRDIPISLPDAYREEARRLRNKLLMYRFRTLSRLTVSDDAVDRTVEPRISQIFQPLLAIVEDTGLAREIRDMARAYHRDLVAERSLEVEAQVLDVIHTLLGDGKAGKVSIGELTEHFQEKHGAEYDHQVTPKWIGTIVRRRLHLRTAKSHGVYVIPLSERPRLAWLFEQHGITSMAET